MFCWLIFSALFNKTNCCLNLKKTVFIIYMIKVNRINGSKKLKDYFYLSEK